MHRLLLPLLALLCSCAPVPAPAAPEYPVARLHLKGDADAEGHNILNLPTDAFALSNGLATAGALSAESAARQSADASLALAVQTASTNLAAEAAARSAADAALALAVQTAGASATNYTDAIAAIDEARLIAATNGLLAAETDPTVPAWAKEPNPPAAADFPTNWPASAITNAPWATTGHVALAVQTASTNFLPLAGGTMTGPLLFDSPGSTVLSGDLSGALPFDIMSAGSVPATQATLSGSLWAYGHDYARDEDIERQVAPSNLVCTYREAGSSTFSCDWIDASTGEPVGSGGHLSLSAYDYGGGYAEASLSGGASLPDGYLECSGYASLASRAPGLSGRAATTDELGAVRSVAADAATQAADAYGVATGRATMSQVNSAIASHNADASAHASAIQEKAQAVVSLHNANLDAHVFAHKLPYVATLGRYVAANSSASHTGTVCDYVVQTTEDSADFVSHGGNFSLEINSLKPGSVTDSRRRIANIVVLVTGVLPDDPSAAIPARAYKPLIRTILVNDVNAFDCGSCATPIRAVMLRVAAFPGSAPQCLQVLDVKCITPAANRAYEAVSNAGELFIGANGRPSSEFRFNLVPSASSSTAFDPVDITISGLWVGYTGSTIPSSGCDRIPTFVVTTFGSSTKPYLFGSRTTVMVCRTGAGMSEAKFKYGTNTITIPLPAFPSGATRDWFRFDVCVENANRCAVTAYTAGTANNCYKPL